jgi:hypothetical protein
MALIDEVTARIPSQVLIELTNPRDNSASSVETTILGKACDAVEAKFEVYAQESYDGDVTAIVEACVMGVVYQLRQWGSGISEVAEKGMTAFREECERIRGVRARAAITPTTDSKRTPSDENPTGGTLRPWADRDTFRGIRPRQPGADYDDDVGQ